MKQEEIEMLAWKSALTQFPYTDQGSLEDDIDSAKRNIHIAAFIEGAKLVTSETPTVVINNNPINPFFI